MERGAWRDERIEEQVTAIDQAFERLHGDLRDVRDELQAMRGEFIDDLHWPRSDFLNELRRVRFDLSRLRFELSSLQRRMARTRFALVGALITALVALIVAIAT
jgi:hypothetical protein